MARAVPVLVAVLTLVTVPLAVGCGSPETRTRAVAGVPESPLAGALLEVEDTPEGFAPAETLEVFAGTDPPDADCARLLALADTASADDLHGSAGRGAEAHAAFYRSEPPVTVAQHVFRPGRAAASAHIDAAGAALEGCPSLRVPLGEGEMRMARVPVDLPGAEDAPTAGTSLAVGYEGPADVSYTIVMLRLRDALLIVTAAGDGIAGEPVEGLAGKAVRRIRTHLKAPGPAASSSLQARP